MAFDQFGLCADVARLGAGVWVRNRERSRADLRRVLDRVLSDEAIDRRAAETGARFAAERDGATVAAAAVERVGPTV
jgi:UDP:flavonoid glycosyltransferase YjiC (YdhE family)